MSFLTKAVFIVDSPMVTSKLAIIPQNAKAFCDLRLEEDAVRVLSKVFDSE